jgi:geranylgeranyl pyrophosphate synthase
MSGSFQSGPQDHPSKVVRDGPDRQTGAFGDLAGLHHLFTTEVSSKCREALDPVLLRPLRGFSGSGSKKIRAGLVEISLRISIGNREPSPEESLAARSISELLETLHAGSLIVDDIQDDATERRGKPTLHREIGIPLAINAGGWLYFRAMSLIPRMNLKPETELEIYRLSHDALLSGHLGQALDIGWQADLLEKDQVHDLSLGAIELKTGALMGLAAELGAVIGGASSGVRSALKTFGVEFGSTLQKFNDLKEFSSAFHGVSHDLLLGRPGWVWAHAARVLPAGEYSRFRAEVIRLRELKNQEALSCMEEIKKHPVIESARHSAEEGMKTCIRNLKCALEAQDPNFANHSEWNRLDDLGMKVMEAYV